MAATPASPGRRVYWFRHLRNGLLLGDGKTPRGRELDGGRESESRRLSALGSGPSSAALIQVPTPVSKPKPLTDAELHEIEQLARTNAAEAYRGPLLVLVDEVRRLRAAPRGGAMRARDALPLCNSERESPSALASPRGCNFHRFEGH